MDLAIYPIGPLPISTFWCSLWSTCSASFCLALSLVSSWSLDFCNFTISPWHLIFWTFSFCFQGRLRVKRSGYLVCFQLLVSTAYFNELTSKQFPRGCSSEMIIYASKLGDYGFPGCNSQPGQISAGLQFFLKNDYSIQFVFSFLYINMIIAFGFLASNFFWDVKTATG